MGSFASREANFFLPPVYTAEKGEGIFVERTNQSLSLRKKVFRAKNAGCFLHPSLWPFDAMRKLGLPPFLSGKGVLRPPATFLPSPSLAFCCCCCRGRRRRRRRRGGGGGGSSSLGVWQMRRRRPRLEDRKRRFKEREGGKCCASSVFYSGNSIRQKLYNEPSMTSTLAVK